ncbi:MAG: hypothetical protein ACO2ZM_08810 [Francisellaceae bacterium]
MKKIKIWLSMVGLSLMAVSASANWRPVNPNNSGDLEKQLALIEKNTSAILKNNQALLNASQNLKSAMYQSNLIDMNQSQTCDSSKDCYDANGANIGAAVALYGQLGTIGTNNFVYYISDFVNKIITSNAADSSSIYSQLNRLPVISLTAEIISQQSGGSMTDQNDQIIPGGNNSNSAAITTAVISQLNTLTPYLNQMSNAISYQLSSDWVEGTKNQPGIINQSRDALLRDISMQLAINNWLGYQSLELKKLAILMQAARLMDDQQSDSGSKSYRNLVINYLQQIMMNKQS